LTSELASDSNTGLVSGMVAIQRAVRQVGVPTGATGVEGFGPATPFQRETHHGSIECDGPPGVTYAAALSSLAAPRITVLALILVARRGWALSESVAGASAVCSTFCQQAVRHGEPLQPMPWLRIGVLLGLALQQLRHLLVLSRAILLQDCVYYADNYWLAPGHCHGE
jgi:hypothetical protein